MKLPENLDLSVFPPYEEMIENAVQNSACAQSLGVLRKYSTLQEMLEALPHTAIAEFACWYAVNVLDGPWPEAECVILKDPETVVAYAADAVKERRPDLETVILTHPMAASNYACFFLKSPWEEAEAVISTHAIASFYYARDLGVRSPCIISAILQNPWWSVMFCARVLLARWPEAEPGILTDLTAIRKYLLDVLKGPWREAEIAFAAMGLQGEYNRIQVQIQQEQER